MSTVPDDLVEGFRLVTEKGFSVRKAAIVTHEAFLGIGQAIWSSDEGVKLR